MAFRRPQIKQITTNIESLQIYLRAERKFGKTTLFRDIVLQKFGNPESGMLVKVGFEDGDALLDEINSTDIQTFEEFLEMIDWVVTQKGKEHDIKMIGVDVIDELIPLVEDYTVKLARRETGKPIKSILEAFGGYNKGPIRAGLELKKAFAKLKKANIGTIAIAHTKIKNVKPKGAMNETDGYDVFTSTLNATYEAVFADIFDIILTGAIDRTVEDGKLAESQRYLYLRGDGFVEAGGRMAFGTVPDKIEFNKQNMAKDVIDILEEGMRKSSIKGVTKEQFTEMQQQQKAELDKKAQEFAEQCQTKNVQGVDVPVETTEGDGECMLIDIEKNKQLLGEIQKKFKTASVEQKTAVKKLLQDNNAVKLDVDTLTTDVFVKALSILG